MLNQVLDDFAISRVLVPWLLDFKGKSFWSKKIYKMPRVKVSKAKLWRGIRRQCLNCVCNSDKEVALCTDPECSLYIFRFGRPLKDSDPVYLPGTGKYKRVDEVGKGV